LLIRIGGFSGKFKAVICAKWRKLQKLSLPIVSFLVDAPFINGLEVLVKLHPVCFAAWTDEIRNENYDQVLLIELQTEPVETA